MDTYLKSFRGFGKGNVTCTLNHKQYVNLQFSSVCPAAPEYCTLWKSEGLIQIEFQTAPIVNQVGTWFSREKFYPPTFMQCNSITLIQFDTNLVLIDASIRRFGLILIPKEDCLETSMHDVGLDTLTS